jgi:hypothetical protein
MKDEGLPQMAKQSDRPFDRLMIYNQSMGFGQIRGYIQTMQRIRVTPPVLI